MHSEQGFDKESIVSGPMVLFVDLLFGILDFGCSGFTACFISCFLFY